MIELENITKIYHMGNVEVPALRGVSLRVERGEMVSLIGASGSGKSTMMNIMGFLDKPSGGRYVLEGVVQRNAEARLLRDNVVVHTGKIGSLRRFKDDVKEVAAGFECGVGLAGYHDLKPGDVLEVFVMEEIAAKL